ncbi:MAG: hypothetical protein COA94_03670, partial [Rickettsiales bacterium]
LGLLLASVGITLVGGSIMNSSHKASKKTEIHLRVIREDVERANANGHVVKGYEDFLAKVERRVLREEVIGFKPYVSQPNDSWGRMIMFEYDKNKNQLIILSYGKDGVEGGDGEDADLSEVVQF